MPDNRLHSVLRYLQRRLGTAGAGGLTDAQLLERFTRDRDEAAFEVLVWRHGTLVWNVCRRVLAREQDVEDAFQATFLIFARKAGSVGRGAAVASWLYKVAYRIALDARARNARRHRQEIQTPCERARDIAHEAVWRDLRPVLDEEVNALPETYRRPFVLCYLEGKTNAEAAAELGCSPGTIFSRLAWARQRLRNRLTRRGVTLSTAALATVIANHAAAAKVPAVLASSTASGAAAFAVRGSAAGLVSAQAVVLMQGVNTAMLLGRLKIAAVLLTAATVAGVPWLARDGRLAYAEANGAARLTRQAPAPPAAEPSWQPLTAQNEENGRVQFSARSVRGTGKTRDEIAVADMVVNHAATAPLAFEWSGGKTAFEGELPASNGSRAPVSRREFWNTFGNVTQSKGSIAFFTAPPAEAAKDGKINAVTFATLWGIVLASGRQDLLAAYSLLEQKPQTVLPCSRWVSDGTPVPARPGAPLFGKLVIDGHHPGEKKSLATFTSTIIEESPKRLLYRYRVENAGGSALQFRWAGFAATVEAGAAFERTLPSATLTEEVPARATFTWTGGKQHAITAHFWKQPS